MKRMITLGQLKDLAEEMSDGTIIRVTFAEAALEEGGDADGADDVSASGSMDPA